MIQLQWHGQYKKRNCGQIAVAVVTGKSVEEIEAHFGHDTGTKTKDLKRALDYYGYTIPNRLKRLKEAPDFCIAKLQHPLRKSWHWVVIHEDKIYDGVWGNETGTVSWLRGYKITSFLPIERKNG